ncbi:MAG: hypothetical protein QXX20_06665 [Candidatus Thermoplasmatota archaeon]
MKIKQRQEVLEDIIKDSKKKPKGWKAAFGRDILAASYDYYIFNPSVGIYLIKEYQKNPYEIKGIGTKIARRIDDDIEEKVNQNAQEFGIIQGDFRKIIQNLQKGIPPEQILEAGIKGNDLGITIPVKGKASASQEIYKEMKNCYADKEKTINSRFEKMLADEGVSTAYS